MAVAPEKTLQNEFIKWGFFVIIGLIGAGLVSLANRNVYSKEQVDEKIQTQATVRAYELRIINNKLTEISEDVQDIKDEVKKESK